MSLIRFAKRGCAAVVLAGVCRMVSAQGTTPAATPEAPQLTAKLIIEDSVENPEAPKYNAVRDGMELFMKRDFDKARLLFADAQKNSKDLPPAEILMARMLSAVRQPQLARAELEKCVKDNEGEPEPYVAFAEAAISEGRVTDAAALIGVAGVKLNDYKDNPLRKNNLIKRYYNVSASVAEARERWTEAEKQLALWIKLDDKSAAAHQRLARVLFQQKSDNPQVMAELKTAAGLEKNLPSPYVSMAQFYEANKDQTNAAKMLEQAVAEKVDATNKDRVVRSHLVATQYYVATNKLAEASKYAEAAVKLDPDSLDAKLTRGIVARMTKDYKTAQSLLDGLNSTYPSNFAVSNNLALVLAELPDAASKSRAVELAKINFDVNKENKQTGVEAAATLGWTLYKKGDLAQAGQLLQAVVNSNQLSADSAYYVARMLADQGKSSEALNVLEQALKTPVFFNRVDAEALVKKLQAGGSTTPAPVPAPASGKSK